MNSLLKITAAFLACYTGISISEEVFAEGKPNSSPIKFDYKLIAATDCVLRPTSSDAIEFSCTPDAQAMKACLNSKGEIGTIDSQLLCKSPRVAVGHDGKLSVRQKQSLERSFVTDATARERWLPIAAASEGDLFNLLKTK